MRVSTNMLTFNYLSSLNKALARQSELQEKMADGKAIHRPSDDPVRAIRSLRFNINLKENEQYTQHVKDAISWMETTDGAMNDLSSLSIRAKELTIKAVSPNPDMAQDAIAKELDEIVNKMVEIGNTKIGDRYIFAGQNDKTQPFLRRMVTNADGTQTDSVVYSGDSNKISMRVQPGVIVPAQDSINLTGVEVFGPINVINENGQNTQTAELLNNLIKVKEVLEGKSPSPKSNPIGGNIRQAAGGEHRAFTMRIDTVAVNGATDTASYSIDGGQTWKAATKLPNGNFSIPKADVGTTADVEYYIDTDSDNKIGDTYTLPAVTTARDTSWLSKTGLYMIDNGHNSILQAETGLGTRMAMYEQSEALLEKNNVIITGDVSANEDLDIAKAMVDFKTSENVYNAALSIGSKLLPPSLADFLR